MIEDFIKRFTDHKFDVVRIGKEFFLDNKELTKLRDKIGVEPFSQGLFLGKIKSKRFYPSPALIDVIAKHSTRKVYVNDKAEWLFLCNKDIFGKSIIKANVRRGICLIQNRIDENLGYGKIISPLDRKNQVVIKNILDRAEYLRMEN